MGTLLTEKVRLSPDAPEIETETLVGSQWRLSLIQGRSPHTPQSLVDPAVTLRVISRFHSCLEPSWRGAARCPAALGLQFLCRWGPRTWCSGCRLATLVAGQVTVRPACVSAGSPVAGL